MFGLQEKLCVNMLFAEKVKSIGAMMYKISTPISDGRETRFVGSFAYILACCADVIQDELELFLTRLSRGLRSNRFIENFFFMLSGGLAVAIIYEYFLGMGWL